MPNCPPIKEKTDNPPDNYPDYVKKIFKEVAEGKEKNLKVCMCKLRIPLDDDFCMIKDEDKKWAIFPFCTEYHPEEDGEPQDYSFIKFTIKEAMEFYWKTKRLNITIDYLTWNCDRCSPYHFDGCCIEVPRSETVKLRRYYLPDDNAIELKEVTKAKELVCPGPLDTPEQWENGPNFGSFNFFTTPNSNSGVQPTASPIWINKNSIYLPVAYIVVFGDESDGVLSASLGEKCGWCHNECHDSPPCKEPICKEGPTLKIKKKSTNPGCYYADTGPIEHNLRLSSDIEEFK
jgi:hypothetical protein